MIEDELKSLIVSVKSYFRAVEGFLSVDTYDSWDRDFERWRGDLVTFKFDFDSKEVYIRFNFSIASPASVKIEIGQKFRFKEGVDFKFEFRLDGLQGNHKMFCQIAHKIIASNYRQGLAEGSTSNEYHNDVSKLKSATKDYITDIKLKLESKTTPSTEREFLEFELEVVESAASKLVDLNNPWGIDLGYAQRLLLDDANHESFAKYKQKIRKILSEL